MYVNVAVLKGTQPHERRVALVPSVTAKLIKLGAKLHMQSGAADAIKLTRLRRDRRQRAVCPDGADRSI
jgi:H+-translocating NAD(P) transhydrogenase subunit alpha